MSNITAALPCCCGENPCGEPCCDPETTSFSIHWSGSFQIIFNACNCDLTVPNYICPCSGSTLLAGGQVGRGTVTRNPPSPFNPCGDCVMQIEAVALQGTGSYFCSCGCTWEDPPGSGFFYDCQQVAPNLCGNFEAISGVGSVAGAFGGLCDAQFNPELYFGIGTDERWYVVLPIRFCAFVRNGCIQDQVDLYCHSPNRSGVFTPGYQGVLYVGPLATRCEDGRLNLNSRRGSYVATNVVTEQAQNEMLIWNPGSVVVT